MTQIETFEIRNFFHVSTELRKALRSGDRRVVYLATSEIMGMWLHSENIKLRARCEAILSEQGWAKDMAEACAEATRH